MCHSRLDDKGGMDIMRRWYWILTIALLGVCFSSSAYADEKALAEKFRSEFTSRFTPPNWWDQFDISDVSVQNSQDLLHYWLEVDHPARKFFKVAYQAILDHPWDEELHIYAIGFMASAEPEYHYKKALLEYAVEKYFDHESPDSQYPSRGIGTVIWKLLEEYNQSRDFEKATDLGGRFMKALADKVDSNTGQLIMIQYAKTAYGLGQTDQAIKLLKWSKETYKGDWDDRIDQEISWYEQLIYNPANTQVKGATR